MAASAFQGTGLRHGLCLNVVEAPYNGLMAAAAEPLQAFGDVRLDAVLVSLTADFLALAPAPGSLGEETAQVEAAVARVTGALDGLRALGCPLVIETLPAPPMQLFGSFDRRLHGTMTRMVAGFNQGLVEALRTEDVVFDVAALAAQVGTWNWADPVAWHHAKLPVAMQLLPLYAEHLCRLIAALKGRSRRCLVLDLDNTLWGGVIGDDGLANLVLGQGSPDGEAFLEVQRTALALRQRGIVLAVCSKNDEAVAREPFRGHPDMLLREDDIAVFQANWLDKAANLRAIAAALSLGTDSLVFLDDNPAERRQVRHALPDVAVPEVPDDPAWVPRILMAAGYFDAVTFSDEDRERAVFYQGNQQRQSLLRRSADYGAYLIGLQMELAVAPLGSINLARAAQLIAKSNQFNLTTRRHSELDLRIMAEASGIFVRTYRLVDVLGDNGLISVVIGRCIGSECEIDTWVMSCRVLSRRVEEAVLEDIAAEAIRRGADRLIGQYIPTSRNGMVADHFAKLGFEQIAEGPEGATRWCLKLPNDRPRQDVIRINDPEPVSASL